MLVKMICGTYGYRPNPDEVRVVRKDSNSPAFELDDTEAKRLIDLGVARAVATSQQPEIGDVDLSGMSETAIMSLEFNDMRKLAKNYGLDTKGTKEELRDRLLEALVESKVDTSDDSQDDEEDDINNDLPPELSAQDPE